MFFSCNWKFGQPGELIRILFDRVNIEYSEDCRYDGVFINGDAYCGDEDGTTTPESWQREIALMGPIEISFLSDGSVGTNDENLRSGFRIRLDKVVEDPCSNSPCQNGGRCVTQGKLPVLIPIIYYRGQI